MAARCVSDMSVAAWKAREMMSSLTREQFNGEICVLQHTINRGDEYWHGKVFPFVFFLCDDGTQQPMSKDMSVGVHTVIPLLQKSF